MLDIHCHILPGVDDGPRTLEESLEIARFCVQDGITHITATPHCHRHLHLLRAEILPHVSQLNQALRAEGIQLLVLPGSEIQLFDVALYRREYEAGDYCHLGDNSAFSLLEFSWQERLYPADAPGQIRWLLERGTQPIIAHPERHGFFEEHPNWMQALVDEGAWLQITVDSLLGNHGPAPEQAGWHLLRQFPDTVLATDAHGAGRCSGLSPGYRIVEEKLGAAQSEDLRRRADRILERLLAARVED